MGNCRILGEVLEAENNVKHGASSQSQTSRENFLICVAAINIFFCSCVQNNQKIADMNNKILVVL